VCCPDRPSLDGLGGLHLGPKESVDGLVRRRRHAARGGGLDDGGSPRREHAGLLRRVLDGPWRAPLGGGHRRHEGEALRGGAQERVHGERGRPASAWAELLLAITTKRGEMTKRSDQHGARAAVTK
jgi:hypothetical protein